jgi:hypothetical protein
VIFDNCKLTVWEDAIPKLTVYEFIEAEMARSNAVVAKSHDGAALESNAIAGFEICAKVQDLAAADLALHTAQGERDSVVFGSEDLNVVFCGRLTYC